MAVLFALVLFVSAGLLFLVQPMIAKMILPKFGGTPAVWTTSMVFFQAALLGGYAYAHALTSRWSLRRQMLVHTGVLLLGMLAVPLVNLPVTFARQWAPPGDANPVLPLMGLLLASVGIPFFVVSTTNPLLQKWFAGSGHASAHDPYFLYAASNAGSLLALVAYPLLVEPTLRLPTQGWWWMAGYGLLVLLVVACAVAVRRRAPVGYRVKAKQPGPAVIRDEELTWGRRLRWVGLAFVPSSLMLGVTTYATTDIAPVPLLWVIPLALYLLSFILVFARLPGWVHRAVTAALPAAILVQMVAIIPEQPRPIWLYLLLHLGAFFVAAMYCHGELAQDRPASGSLTEFYFWLSVGGVLGGLFNAVVAPLAFRVIAEYPLVVALVCLLDRPPRNQQRGNAWKDLMVPVGLGVLAAWLVPKDPNAFLRPSLRGSLLISVAAATGCWALALWLSRRPVRFGLGVGIVMAAMTIYGSRYSPEHGRVVHNGRSFFGVHRLYVKDGLISMVHGATLHGQQRLGADDKPVMHPEPRAYYHRDGPIGAVFAQFHRANPSPPVAAVGLGAGSVAAYGVPGQEFVFYEIDPAIDALARDTRYFTYLSSCAADWRVVLGDGRLSLQSSPDGHYGLIVLDAFSSDAIPVHLVTREALQLYLQKLAPGGMLAFHVSNRYLDLGVALSALAWDAKLPWLACVDEPSPKEGRNASTWVILARDEASFGALVSDPRWFHLQGRPNVPVWSDDFSNVLSVFRWQQRNSGDKPGTGGVPVRSRRSTP